MEKVMRTVNEFMANETDIICEFARVIKERGFDTEVFTNLEGSKTVAVNLVDNDGNKCRCYACFEIA